MGKEALSFRPPSPRVLRGVSYELAAKKGGNELSNPTDVINIITSRNKVGGGEEEKRC